MTTRIIGFTLLLSACVVSFSEAAQIQIGTPTTNVPEYLTDGTYQPFAVSVTLAADQFLLPIEVTGAAALAFWQFDLSFDNTVVGVVDPLDGTAGIYGGRFTPPDAVSQAFILSGLPLNSLGLVDDVAGSYPGLLTGPSGDGVLAYVLFEFLPDQAGNDPDVRVANRGVTQVPEPAAAALLLLSLTGVCARRHRLIEDKSVLRGDNR